MTKKVYISGPMTGYQNYNREAFHRAARHLRAKGYEAVNPAEMDAEASEHINNLDDMPHWWFMRRDIKALLDCDLIYLLPGWTHSKGATLEADVAKGVGIDELVDSDRETWSTFEGEPEIEEAEYPSPCDGTQGSECAEGLHVARFPGGEIDHLPRHEMRCGAGGLTFPEGKPVVAPSDPAWEHATGCEGVQSDGTRVWCKHGVEISGALG